MSANRYLLFGETRPSLKVFGRIIVLSSIICFAVTILVDSLYMFTPVDSNKCGKITDAWIFHTAGLFHNYESIVFVTMLGSAFVLLLSLTLVQSVTTLLSEEFDKIAAGEAYKIFEIPRVMVLLMSDIIFYGPAIGLAAAYALFPAIAVYGAVEAVIFCK